jgi:hypothetical protein
VAGPTAGCGDDGSGSGGGTLDGGTDAAHEEGGHGAGAASSDGRVPAEGGVDGRVRDGATDARSTEGGARLSVRLDTDNVLGTVTIGDCIEQPSCRTSVTAGESVSFEAVPGFGMRFAGFRVEAGPAIDCPMESCTVTVTEPLRVMARFDSVHNLAFVTPDAWSGAEVGGLFGADAKCTAAAAAANLPGTYRAWLSTPAEDARDRFGAARGWLRLDGLPFADRMADLTGGRALAPVAFLGDGTRQWVEYWTGTAGDGTLGGESRAFGPGGTPLELGSCEGWSSTEGAATVGSSTHAGAGFTDASAPLCDQSRRLLCLGSIQTEPLDEPAAEGRLAFVSAGRFDPSSGLAGADSICATEAASASLAGSFKALLATSTASALSRFDLSGDPWVRVDGMPWVRQPGDLADESAIPTALNVQADGTYVSSRAQDDRFVITGGRANQTPDADRLCNDWTLGELSETVDMLMGSPQGAYENGMSCCSGPCLFPRRIYCLEE